MKSLWYVGLMICLLTFGRVQAENTAIQGTLNDTSPLISYALNLGASQRVNIEAVRLNGDLDVQLYLLDAENRILAENDDRDSSSNDAQIIMPDLPAGTYYLLVTRYNIYNGLSSGDFELRLDFSAELVTEAIEYALSPEDLAATGYPDFAVQAQADWSIFVYYDGDNDLEGNILADLQEFERAGGSNERVRIIALVDRNPDYSTEEGDWSNVRLYELTGTVENPETRRLLADLPELDMGDGLTLAQFLTWSLRHYPADHYAVAFGTHGASWNGLVRDESSANSILSLSELQAAFQQSLTASNTPHFDLLINDACNMSAIEYYNVVEPYFDLSFASAEVVMSPALDMGLLIALLNTNPDIELDALGTELINRYIHEEQFTGEGLRPYLTYAVTDLSDFSRVNAAINHFAALVQTDMPRFGAIVRQARDVSYSYTAFLGFDSNIDVGDFMQLVLNFSAYEDLNAAAQQVLTELDLVRAYGDAGTYANRRTSYYSIYFPSSSSEFSQDYLIETPLSAWGIMLQNFYAAFIPHAWVDASRNADTSLAEVLNLSDTVLTDGIASTELDRDLLLKPQIAFHEPNLPQVQFAIYPLIGSADTAFQSIYAHIGRNISERFFVVDRVFPDGRRLRLYDADLVQLQNGEIVPAPAKTGVDGTVIQWAGMLPELLIGTTANVEYVRRRVGTAFIDGRYRLDETDSWKDVVLSFARQGSTLTQAFSTDSETGTRAAITIPDGAIFETYAYQVSADGETSRILGNRYTWQNAGVAYRLTRAEDGDYQAGMRLLTSTGATVSQFEALQIDNAIVPPNTATFMDIQRGVMFQYPTTWGRTVLASPAGNITQFQIPETSAQMSIIPRLKLNEELDAFYEVVSSLYTGLTVSKLDFQQEDGLEIATLEGQAPVLGESYLIRAWIFTNQTTGQYVAVTLAAPESASDLVASLYAEFSQRVTFFQLETAPDWTILFADFDADTSNRTGFFAFPSNLNWQYTIEYPDYAPVNLQWHLAGTAQDYPLLNMAFITGNDLSPESLFAYAHENIPPLATVVSNEERIYYGDYGTWHAQLFESERDGVPTIGRIYVAVFNTLETQAGAIIWAEVPADDLDTLYQTIEPFVDTLRYQMP